jgi:hypothetical protein
VLESYLKDLENIGYQNLRVWTLFPKLKESDLKFESIPIEEDLPK